MNDGKIFILISSWQDVSYAIYLIKKKKIKNVYLIFFDKTILNFLKKNFIHNYKVSYLFIDVPYIDLSLKLKNIFKILYYPVSLYSFQKRILDNINFNNKIIYTFGNEIAFKNAIFLRNSKFNKVYTYDILKLKKELLNSKNNIHSKYLSNISIKRIKFIWHFLFYNFVSGNNYKFWFNGSIYRYFKYRNFKNETYLSSEIFKDHNFTKTINSLIKKKRDKNSVILLLGDNLNNAQRFINQLNVYFKLLKIMKLNKFKIYLKFHPDISEKDFKIIKKKIISLKKNKYTCKTFTLDRLIPIELIDIIPLYYIGYDSGAFKFLNPMKKNIVIKSNKLLHNSYKKIYYKYARKIKVMEENHIISN